MIYRLYNVFFVSLDPHTLRKGSSESSSIGRPAHSACGSFMVCCISTMVDTQQ